MPGRIRKPWLTASSFFESDGSRVAGDILLLEQQRMNLSTAFRALFWSVGLLALVGLCGMLHSGIAAEPTPAAIAGPPQPPEPPRFKPHVSLDRDTGLLTYSVINVSDKPVDVRLTTINGDKYNNGCIRLGGRQTAGGINELYDIGVDGEEYAQIVELPDGDFLTPGDEAEDVRWKILDLVDEKHVLRRIPPGNPAVPQKRVVTLLPGEGLSRSLILQDQPWYDDVVAILEGSGLTKYRIQPLADVYVVETDGFTTQDSGTYRVYSGDFFPGDDEHVALYPVPGVKFDLAFAKKLQAKKTKAAAARPDAAPVQPGDNPPAGKTGD